MFQMFAKNVTLNVCAAKLYVKFEKGELSIAF